MKNKEFLAQFSRHLIRNAANLRIEPKIEIAPLTAAVAEPVFESEKRQAEKMMNMKPSILPQQTIIPPIDISRIADRQFAIPAPELSPQEVSLRKEIETAKQQVMGNIAPNVKPKTMVTPMPSIVKPKTFTPASPEIQNEENSFSLGKLNIFMKNPEITSIECNGPDSVIVIRKGTLPINTSTVLSKDEINDVIHKFSVATKTEITPIYKASHENLVMTAFISPLIGTRFVINKAK
jgi:hypothetical protein